MAAQRFRLGRLLMTPGAQRAMAVASQDPLTLLARHSEGDWGDVGPQDRDANERALVEGARILSTYQLAPEGPKLWVITEADRAATTILLPEEY